MLDQQSLHCIARDEYTTRFDDDELVYLRKIIGPEQKALDLSEHGRLQSPAVFVHVTDGMIRKHSPHEIKTYLSQVVGLERMPSLFGLDA